MYQRKHSKFYPNISADAVWRGWTDVDNWPRWHDDLDYCRLVGPFALGSHFYLKPKGAPRFKIRITAVDEGKSFTDCTHFLGAKMYDTHTIEEKDGGVLLTNTLEVKGLLTKLWVKLVAKNVADTVPSEMDLFIKMCRNETVNL